MQFAIVELYSDGARLPRDSVRAQAAITGDLVIDEWQLEGRRTVLRATLYIACGARTQRIGAPPLFDVRIARMTTQGFLLRGFQIVLTDGFARELVQAWWVRLAQSA